jgi:hypothetical protein
MVCPHGGEIHDENVVVCPKTGVPCHGDDAFRQSAAVNRRFFLPIILLGGLCTTAVVFVVNYVANVHLHFNPFGFMICFIIPIGAVIGGVAAGSGYSIAARITQFRPGTRFLFFVFVLQFLVFLAARYTEYSVSVRMFREQTFQQAKEWIRSEQHQAEQQNEKLLDENGNEIVVTDEMIQTAVDETIEVPSFVTFYRADVEETEHILLKGGHRFKYGIWGWGIELLTMFAFAFSSIATSSSLSEAAYCKDCSLFMNERLSFTYPCKDVIAMKNAADKVIRIRDVLKSEQAGNNDAVLLFLTAIRDETVAETIATEKIPNFLQVTFADCKNCGDFHVTVQITITDTKNQTAVSLLKFCDKQLVTDNVDLFRDMFPDAAEKPEEDLEQTEII